MNRPVTGRLVGLAMILAGSLVFFLPSLPFEKPEWWAGVMPEKGIELGLDLQGGMHLVLGVDTDVAIRAALERDVASIVRNAKSEAVVGKAADDGSVTVNLNTDTIVEIKRIIADTSSALEMSVVGNDATFSYGDAYRAQMVRQSVSQVVETMRNRIDQFGVLEPSIQTQGEDKIVIQLPGIEDPQRAIELIGTTALLEFKIVSNDPGANALFEQIQKSIEERPELESDFAALLTEVGMLIPAGTELALQRSRDEFGYKENYILLEDRAELNGDGLANASVRFGNDFNEPLVSLEFTPEGGETFSRLTGENVNRQMAIVLDGVVRSAPVIRQKISGGSAQIDGIGTLEEARDVAVVLRAGALPAPVNIEEERTVGPTLGQDSIRRGLLALAFGSVMVIVFMLVYYQIAGVFAVIALTSNVIMVVGTLGLFGATLTLPGIAGIVLTIGMAVDANIIIFERIREELREGRNVRNSISTGFGKATWAILDANITTILAALILFQFGSGPIKGFAVTLSVGVVTTLIAALFITRLLFDLYTRNRRLDTLRI